MNTYEVWLVELPFAGGHEQSGFRPAIILGQVVANTVLVIPCTSNQSAHRFPFTVVVSPSKVNGLTHDSVALCFQLRAIDVKRVSRKLGKLSLKDSKQISHTLSSLIA